MGECAEGPNYTRVRRQRAREFRYRSVHVAHPRRKHNESETLAVLVVRARPAASRPAIEPSRARGRRRPRPRQGHARPQERARSPRRRTSRHEVAKQERRTEEAPAVDSLARSGLAKPPRARPAGVGPRGKIGVLRVPDVRPQAASASNRAPPSLVEQARALLAGERDAAPTPPTSLADLPHLPDLNWAGFYWMKGGELVLGPFQGKPAVRAHRAGRGVCGTARARAAHDRRARRGRFPGHIACDSASRSELVVPSCATARARRPRPRQPSLARFDEASAVRWSASWPSSSSRTDLD
jgi:GAF domain-containing protein